MKIKFKPHQQKVLNYFKKYEPRGILLFHGLGSGKTITSLGITDLYKKDVICVVPASMRTQWVKEIKKVGLSEKRYNIMSYEGFSTLIKNKKEVDNKIVIIDEAHRLRNDGGISKSVIKMTKDAFKVILLTGTPMVNEPSDFSNLANLIYGDEVLPMSTSKFEEKYMTLESKSSPTNSKKCELFSAVTCSEGGLKYKKEKYCKYHLYMTNKRTPLKKRKKLAYVNKDYRQKQKDRIINLRMNFKHLPKKINKKEFEKDIQCLTSYYTPDLSNDYPKVISNNKEIKMSKEQNLEYKKALGLLDKKDLKSMESKNKIITNVSKFNAFLNKSRRISNISSNATTSPKLECILKLCKKGPKPIIIYSNWIDSGVVPMSELLTKNKITNYSFTGSKTDKQKKEIVESYNNGDIDVILISSSGAEGLDLKKTRQIHIMEPHWNMAKIQQVIGRGIRYKSHEDLPLSKRLVTVYYWVSMPDLAKGKSGADEYLYELSNDKVELINNFLNVIKNTAIETNICFKK
jgi:superfamily II DNA or RNA helicase